MNDKYNVLEIFSSISGEAQHAGELTTFIRLAGCNLNCSWCDTAKMLKENNFTVLTTSEIVHQCQLNGHKHVIVTGGEPLIKPNICELIGSLIKAGFEVEIETNGSVDFHPIVDRLADLGFTTRYSFTLDYKMPGSGMEDKMNPEVFEHLDDLNSDDVIKFVVTEDDIEPCMKLIKKFQENTLCMFYISPVFGQVNMEHIVDAMKRYNMGSNVRCQVQLHKIIWDPSTTGV